MEEYVTARINYLILKLSSTYSGTSILQKNIDDLLQLLLFLLTRVYVECVTVELKINIDQKKKS